MKKRSIVLIIAALALSILSAGCAGGGMFEIKQAIESKPKIFFSGVEANSLVGMKCFGLTCPKLPQGQQVEETTPMPTKMMQLNDALGTALSEALGGADMTIGSINDLPQKSLMGIAIPHYTGTGYGMHIQLNLLINYTRNERGTGGSEKAYDISATSSLMIKSIDAEGKATHLRPNWTGTYQLAYIKRDTGYRGIMPDPLSTVMSHTSPESLYNELLEMSKQGIVKFVAEMKAAEEKK